MRRHVERASERRLKKKNRAPECPGSASVLIQRGIEEARGANAANSGTIVRWNISLSLSTHANALGEQRITMKNFLVQYCMSEVDSQAEATEGVIASLKHSAHFSIGRSLEARQ